MPRAAGNSSHYEFVLRRASGSYDKDVVISLPSVTHVIKSVLSKPLDNWIYGTTVDNISGMISVFMDDHSVGHLDNEYHLFETLTDGDMLREYLKENRLRPEDVANDASTRGTREHEMLEHLAKAYLESDETAAEQIARRTLARDSSSPWAKATAAWWLERYPTVVASEEVLHSLKLGVAGTVDLIVSAGGYHEVIDLKTRGAGKVAYRSDFVQLDGYSDMWEEMTDKLVLDCTVLVVRDDGTYDEYREPRAAGSFEKVKDVYDTLKGVR